MATWMNRQWLMMIMTERCSSLSLSHIHEACIFSYEQNVLYLEVHRNANYEYWKCAVIWFLYALLNSTNRTWIIQPINPSIYSFEYDTFIYIYMIIIVILIILLFRINGEQYRLRYWNHKLNGKMAKDWITETIGDSNNEFKELYWGIDEQQLNIYT